MPQSHSHSSVKNRRQFLRVPSNCNVVAEKIHFSAKANTEVFGEVKNIGVGGLMFVADSDCHENDMFKVTITLPRWSNASSYPRTPDVFDLTPNDLTTVCQVIRSKPTEDGQFEVAAKFVNVYEEDMDGLRHFIDGEADRLGITL
jgi:hypothetical protein